MKQIACICVLFAMICGLAGCAETAAPVVETPAVETLETPEPEAEPEAPVEIAEPEQPAEPEPELEPEPAQDPEILWDAQPMYVYNGDDCAVAVDPAGQVVLKLEDGKLSLLRDSFTGEVRGILAGAEDGDSLYDCQGRLILEGVSGISFGCTDRVFWYNTELLSGCTIRSWNTGDIQRENLKSVSVLGNCLYVEQVYWNDPALLLAQDGTLVRELERGFSGVAVVSTEGRDYLIVEARDGTQGLLDQEGNSCLDSFYEQVIGISGNCALVKAGDEYGAIDLASGETVFRSREPLAGLLPEGAILGSMEAPSYQVVDRDGNLLYPKALDQFQIWEEDGEAVFLWGLETDQNGITWGVFLEPDGTERLRVQVGLGGLTVLSSQWAVCGTNRGTQGGGLNRIYDMVDLTTGETAQLPRLYSSVYAAAIGGETYLMASYTEGDAVLQDVLSCDGQPLLTGLEACTDMGCGVFQCRQGDRQGLLCLDGTWLYAEAMDNELCGYPLCG